MTGSIARYGVVRVLRGKLPDTLSVKVLHLNGSRLPARAGGKPQPRLEPTLFAVGMHHIVTPYVWDTNPEAPHFCVSGGESDLFVVGPRKR